jgi:hypothetical protein
VIDGSSLEFGKNTLPVPQMTTRGSTTRIIMPTLGGGISTSQKPKKDKKSEKASTETKVTENSVDVKPLAEPTSHGLSPGVSLGVVYANAPAQAEIKKENPQFAVGSIIVREKLTAEGATPELVIAMVKREKGFSEKTGDWEFFVFDGKDLKINSRETVGSCSACHINAEKTDWVFRDYLK